MMGLLEIARQVWFLIYNKYCSIWISNDLGPITYIIPILYCDNHIDDVDSNAP